MATAFEPHQLKNKVRVEQLEEFDFDLGDEDALVLQAQPYETVTSIGHRDFFHHLNTKLIARRSDIIVSSTMSITLAPQDDFVPMTFADLTRENVDEWIEKREQYRAHYVESNRLPTREELSDLETDSDGSAQYELI